MHDQEFLNQKTAVILDTRVLAKRCLDLDQEIQDWRQRCESLEHDINQMNNERQRQDELVSFAQAEINRVKHTIHTNIRAIELHTGMQDRLRFLQSKTENAETSPQELSQIHQSLQDEVRHLYPNQPQSKRTELIHNQRLQQSSILSFRFAG